MGEQGTGKLRQIEAAAECVIEQGQCRRGIAAGEGRAERHDQAAIGDSEHCGSLVFREAPLA